MNLFGLHHVSAITSSLRECADFYGGLLGLGPAADPGENSLAFTADPTREGGVLSFVVSPGTPRGTAGRGLVHRLQWSVAGPTALDYWRRRLEGAGIGVTAWLNGAGDPLALRFSDPEGLDHELALPSAFVLSGSYAGERTNAEGGSLLRTVSAVPPEMRIQALTGLRAYAAASIQSGDLLAGRLGFESCGEGSWRVGTGEEIAAYLCDPPPPSRPVQGAGTVRHVAWTCGPGEERAWRQRVIGMGATVSRVIDCDGYRCFFFREPDGVLFGVATRHAPAGALQPRFQLPQPAAIPPRIARPIGILAAA
ncbi:MAG TPA: VOC family protein [Solirubrobacterales bacterium]|nr:VOC family protein [Solirubrobacterales bacterium]